MKIMQMVQKSNVSSKSWKQVLLVTVLTAAAAGLAYLGENLTAFDFGKYTVFIVPALTAMIAFGKQWIQEWLAKPEIDVIGK